MKRAWVIPLLLLAPNGCAEMSSSSRDIVTHCTQHTIGGDSKIAAAGTTTVEDCDISIDTKSKSTGF